MKRVIIFLIFFSVPSFSLLDASETRQILKKLDSLEGTISDLSLRILVLEKKIISLEEKFMLGPIRNAEKQPLKIPEPEGFEYSDDDFYIENVTYETQYNNTVFKGTITNKSNNSYRYALFKVSVYNEKGAVLTSNDFYILNFDKHTQRSFEATIHGFRAVEFKSYTIEFNKGS